MKKSIGLWEHTASTIALCLCTFTHSYLLISVFPYSGFMAIDLIPSANEENAGSYAGLIASAFMLGRALSSYGWGKLSDVYGRKAVLYASLCLSCAFTLLFGMATSFPLALFWRFLLGLGNGLLIVAKTAVSELAAGDENLETRGMGLVMGMWGLGFMVGPAVSGALAEPIRQYPDADWLHESSLHPFLARYPFFLPNLIGAIFCIVSLVFVRFFVTETLPEKKIRHTRYFPQDAWSYLTSFCPTLPSAPKNGEDTPIMSDIHPSYDESSEYEDLEDGSDVELPQHVLAMAMLHDDISDAIRQSQIKYDESVVLLCNARDSLPKAITRRTSVAAQQHRISQLSEASHGLQETATIASLWRQIDTRNHLIVYWIASFVMVAVDEGLPLFCLSKEAGLGLSESSIGNVLSTSGLVFVSSQYLIYSWLVDWVGLYGSIRIGSVCMGPLVALIPFSLWLNQGAGDDELTWQAFAFLVAVMAIYRIFGLAFFSSITVAANRTVLPSQRGTMNGLSTSGGSIAKGAGPAFAGLLVAFSFSSGVFSPHVGAAFMFLVIGGIGALTTIATFVLLHEPDE